MRRAACIVPSFALTHGSRRAFDNYFLKAQKVRLLLRREFDSVFRVPSALVASSAPTAPEAGVDILITPTALTPAPILPSTMNNTASGSEEDRKITAQKKVRDAWAQDVLLVPASLAGIPAISVPVHPVFESNEAMSRTRDSGWTGDEGEDTRPVGVQVVAQWGGETTVLRVADEILKMPRMQL